MILRLQGDGEDIWGSIQRSSSYDPRISPGTPGDVPATPFYFPVNGNRLSQEPACRCSVFQLHQDLPQNFNVNRFIILYGFRNLNYCRLRQMEQLFLQGQRKQSSLLVFLPCHPTLTCQTLRDCLCTTDALHNSNSIRIFWASVSFLLYTSSWQEPFGESLSRLTIDSKTMSEFTLLN